MARITLSEMMNHKKESAEKGGFRKFATNFYFKRDGRQNALVKLLITGAEDVPVFTTHTVQKISKSGKKYFQEVDCMGEGCPLCNYAINNQNGIVSFRHDKIVIPIINFTATDADGNNIPQVQYWTRSSGFYSNTILPFAERFGLDGYVEIQKNGTGKQTTYTLYPVEDKFGGRPLEAPLPVEEYLKEYDVNIDEDLKSIVRELSDNEISAIIGGSAVGEESVAKEEPARPVRRSAHGF